LVAALAVATGAVVYGPALWRGGTKSAADKATDRIRDMLGLRAIAAAAAFATMGGRPMPLARDGRVDVYAMLRSLGKPRDELVRFCFGAGAGRGPSRAEFDAGDYSNFPYQRRRGSPDPGSAEGAPVAWDREPRDGERLVALSDGAVLTWPEEAMQRYFRENPGQE
jgi:hypothetical protein